MPVTPTPCVNGQVVGSPALQASRSISSFDPDTTTDGSWASIATVGSFCLFCAKGEGGLPTDTRVSPWADAGIAGSASAMVNATAPNVKTTRFTKASLLGEKRTLGRNLIESFGEAVKRR